VQQQFPFSELEVTPNNKATLKIESSNTGGKNSADSNKPNPKSSHYCQSGIFGA